MHQPIPGAPAKLTIRQDRTSIVSPVLEGKETGSEQHDPFHGQCR